MSDQPPDLLTQAREAIAEAVANEPISLGERRALANNDSSQWTPRELLVWVLRQIDSGASSPEGLMVCYFWHEGKGTVTGMKRSKTTIMEAVAMIEMAKNDLLNAD